MGNWETNEYVTSNGLPAGINGQAMDEVNNHSMRNGIHHSSRETPHTSHARCDTMEPIAIIGMASRLPQDASNTEDFWKMLLKGRSARTEIPSDRFNIDSFYHPDPDRLDTMNLRAGYFLKEDVGLFDASFFSIPPVEAPSMDPQQRLMLETAYHAFENAGISMDTLAGSQTCCYVGFSARDYESILLKDSEQPSKYLGTGVGVSLIANRVSWFFDLKGPSVALDTGCSSSLMALHLACQSLRNHETNMGLVGGCSLLLAPDISLVALSNMGFFSPDGTCYTFDSRANGYGKGEGLGAVVLKRLDDAVRDGDNIRAVIRGTRSNQDGRTPGLTQPSRASQTENIQTLYREAGLDLSSTGCFEAHGTGTKVGDVLEAEAIHHAFQRGPENPLYIGALKQNIGHLEAASGVAALIKSVLVLENGLIPGNINFQHPNPNIPLDKWNLKFPTKLTRWPKRGLRRLSLNSFGWGGTNVHCVLDDAYHFLAARQIMANHATVQIPRTVESVIANGYTTPFSSQITSNGRCVVDGAFFNAQLNPNGAYVIGKVNGVNHLYTNGETKESVERQANGTAKMGHETQSHHDSHDIHDVNDNDDSFAEALQDMDNKTRLLVLSAADEPGLQRLAETYKQYAEQKPESNAEIDDTIFDNLAYTLASKRSRLAWKSFAIATSSQDVKQGLETSLSKPIRSSVSPPLLFVFTGQGAQYYQMGLELARYDVFRKSLQKADAIIKAQGSTWSLIQELCRDKTSSRVSQSAFSQPLCTALQLALIDLLRSWSIVPAAVVGHSSGEIAAAYCADALNFDSAIRVAYYRGVVARTLEESSEVNGAMSAVAMSEDDIAPYLAQIQSANKNAKLEVGCVNSPTNVTITGDSACIDQLNQELEKKGIFARRLAVKVPYHSSYMKIMSNKYRSLMDTLQPCIEGTRLNISIFSSVTGAQITPEKLSKPDYWIQNLTSQVRFAPAMAEMVEALGASANGAVSQIVEIGPHGALNRPIKDILKASDAEKMFEYDFMLARGEPPLKSSLQLIGRLWCKSVGMNLQSVNTPTPNSTPPAQQLIDLPQYPFNHTQRYWQESRISKNYRFRKHARHDFLGSQVPDWNDQLPRWRSVVRPSELPWLFDYKIHGMVQYPPAALLVMAIEAARQTANPLQTIQAFEVTNVSFLRPVVFTEATDEMEIQFHLQPQHDKDDSRFSIFAWIDDAWAELCHGCVATHYTVSELDFSSETFYSENRRCRDVVGARMYFRNIADLGYEYGSCFQKMQSLRYTQNKAAAQLTIRSPDSNQTYSPSSHVIHPTDLEAMLQLGITALNQGSWTKVPRLSPSSLDRLWVSNNLLDADEQVVETLAKISSQGFAEAKYSVVAVDADTNLLVRVDGLRTTAEKSLDAHDESEAVVKKLCHRMIWKPDPDMLSSSQLEDWMRKAGNWTKMPPAAEIDLVELMSLNYVSEALRLMGSKSIEDLPPHLQKFVKWMRHVYDQKTYDMLLSQVPGFADPATREKMITDFAARDPLADMIMETGKNLTPVLEGKLDGLDLLYHSGLAEKYYFDPSMNIRYDMISAYFDLLSHKNPNLRVIDIGAGTGAVAVPILNMLGGQTSDASSPRFSQYMYTDISPAFFEKAKERFADHSARMEYRTLNIEKTPADQGFEAGSYDVAVCCLCLHATTDMMESLKNVRSLLKPGGKLVLFEPTNPKSCLNGLSFGLLPGWWLGVEKEREWSPLLSDENWNKFFEASGFSGTEICIPDYNGRQQMNSILITSASEETAVEDSTMNNEHYIVIDPSVVAQQELATRVKSSLKDTGVEYQVLSLEQLKATDMKRITFISLLDIDHSFLSRITSLEFESLKLAVDSASSILWVTQGGGKRPVNPYVALSTGFGRNVMSERLDTKFIELALGAGTEPQHAAQRILEMTVRLKGTNDVHEPEFVEDYGRLDIPRLCEAKDLNSRLYTRLNPQRPETQAFTIVSDRALHLTIAEPGNLDTLHFIDNERREKALPDDEIEVHVHATGLNQEDTDLALGNRTGTLFGTECAGIVTQVGLNTSFEVGDRVCTYTTSGSVATYARSKTTSAARIPDGMSYAFAAALPVAFLTAYYGLSEAARLREEETVLIHPGMSAVGQVAIQVALSVRAEVYVTVDKEEERQALADAFPSLKPENIIISSFSTSEYFKMQEQAIDVILSATSIKTQQDAWRNLAPLGRYIDISGSEATADLSNFPRNAQYTSVDLRLVHDSAQHVFGRMVRTLQSWLSEEKLHPFLSSQIFSISDMAQAFAVMSPSSREKVVLEMTDNATVNVCPKSRSAYALEEDATYVIAGGSGGLGRAIVVWMVEKGARHILLLSRSGSSSLAVQDLIEDMGKKGVHVTAPSCDVSDAKRLNAVLEEVQVSMPPIKGCVQGSMVLRDGMLENLTHADWHGAIGPKVQGSWNLHSALPADLSFFVLLASVAGVTGSRTQSNYAAANTYQDALARYRTSNGQRAISINLGAVRGAGFSAENRLDDMLEREGFMGIRKAEFLSVLDYYCDPTLPLIPPEQAQIVMGLGLLEELSPDKIAEIYWARKSIFSVLRQTNACSQNEDEDEATVVDYSALLAAATTPRGRAEIVRDAIIQKLARLLLVPPEQIDPLQPIFAAGIDSLVALSVQYWFRQEFGVDISVKDIMGQDTLYALAELVAEKAAAPKE